MESLYDCLKAWWKYGYEVEYFWVSGVTLVCVGLFGLLGNLANLVVLFEPELRTKTFYKLLIVLAFFDILFILSFSISTGYQSLACQPTNDNVGYFTLYFHKIASIGSTYTTVAISLERFFGICLPYIRMSRNLNFYVIPILFVTTFVNAPIVFERVCHIGNNRTLECPQHDWATGETYKLYANIVAFIFQTAIPIPTLILINGAILFVMLRSSKELKGISRNMSYRNKSTTKMLLLVVITTFICEGLRIAYKSLYIFGCKNEQESKDEDCPEQRDKMTSWNFIAPIEKLAFMLNSSVNFLIYCLVGKRFRTIFCRVFHLSSKASVSNSLINKNDKINW